MQICGNKSPIVTHSSKFLPPPVLDIQVNKLLENIQASLFRIHLELTKHCTVCVRNLRLNLSRSSILVYVCITDHFHLVLGLMVCTSSALSRSAGDPFSENILTESTSSVSNKDLIQSANGMFDQYIRFSTVNTKVG